MDELADVRRALQRPPLRIDDPAPRRAAVAAIFSPGRRLWFVRRAEHPNDPWSGQLAFPGGHAEPHDADLRATAVRETWEEIGVDLTDAEWLGDLDDLRTRPVRDRVIRPSVFRVSGDLLPRLNHEVAAVHAVPLDTLLAGVGRGSLTWPGAPSDLRFPSVEVDGHPLWGLTLAMVDDLLDRLDGRGRGHDRPAHR